MIDKIEEERIQLEWWTSSRNDWWLSIFEIFWINYGSTI